jgi:hypothetical protein
VIPRLLARVLAVALVASGATRAVAEDPAGATSTAEPLEPAGATSLEIAAPEPAEASTTTGPAPAPAEGTWLDVGHAFIEHRIFAPALRVDRFFSDERDLEPERARSFIQWRQEFRFTEFHRNPQYTTTFNANLKLPGINKQLRRLQLEVTGQTRDVFTNLFPGGTAPADVTTSENTFGTTDAGLGFRLFETLANTFSTHGDLGGGVILTLPPGVYTRARLRFVESLGARVLARQALTGFWRTDTLFGSTGSAELERPFAWGSLVRLSGTTTITERSRGFEWSGDLSLIGTVALRIGAQLGYGVSGATEAPVAVDVHRFYLRLRRDVYRRWIFVELDPEYGWPWMPIVGRRGTWSVGLRLEVQFQGNEAPLPGTVPDLPEPHDPHVPQW